MKKIQKGFTLIELLVVIAIIGILASVVTASVSGAKAKANKAAAIKVGRSMMGELALCSNSDGFGFNTAVPTAGSTFLCQNASTGNVQFSGHPLTWGSLGSTGYSYTQPSGSITANPATYTWTMTNGSTVIICSFLRFNCQ